MFLLEVTIFVIKCTLRDSADPMIEKKTLKTEVACGKFPLRARKMVECGSLVLSSGALLPKKKHNK